MTNQTFFLQLGVVTLLTAAALWGLFQVPSLAPYQTLGWVSLGGFVLISLLMFFTGRSSAQSDNKNTFTSTVLGFTAGKMMLAIMIVFAYIKLAEPADRFFVIPFFAVYFIFTAFETYFMMKLGRTGV
ncbi:MAG: hypothetical protein AAFO02_01675 [Bacteroidota bacterium]